MHLRYCLQMQCNSENAFDVVVRICHYLMQRTWKQTRIQHHCANDVECILAIVYTCHVCMQLSAENSEYAFIVVVYHAAIMSMNLIKPNT